MTSQPAPQSPRSEAPRGGAYEPQVPPSDQGSARPTSITVLGTLGAVLGALGLLCKPVGLLYALVQIPHPIAEAIRNDSFLRGWTVVSVGTGWLMSLLLLLASIGSLRLRDWGRSGMLTYAVLAVT